MPADRFEPTIPLRRAQTRPLRAGALSGRPAGLLFDTGGVLYDENVWPRWLLRLVRQLGVEIGYARFFQLWKSEFQTAVYCGQCPLCDALRNFLRSLGLSAAQFDEVEAACRAQRRLVESGIRPLPGVKTTLSRLSQSGYALAALSNSEHPAEVLRQRLERFGLEGLMTTVVSSLDLRRIKPDPFCYLSALGAMGLPPHRVAFVGHDAEELAGAAAVGMPTVAFNYDHGARADVFIARFEELCDVVEPRPLAAAG